MQSTRQTIKSRANRAEKRLIHKRERRAINLEERNSDESDTSLQRSEFFQPDIPIVFPQNEDEENAFLTIPPYHEKGYYVTKNGGLVDETDLAHISSSYPIEDLDRAEGEMSPDELANRGISGFMSHVLSNHGHYREDRLLGMTNRERSLYY